MDDPRSPALPPAALDVLARPPDGLGWTEPAALRRAAATRRRRRRATIGGAGVALGVAAALVATSVAGGGSAPERTAGPARRGPAALAPGVRSIRLGHDASHLVTTAARTTSGPTGAVARDEAAFAIALTRAQAAAAPSRDTVVSPLSASVALSMLELGAGGQTEKAIAKTLQSAGVGAPAQAAAWASLQASLAAPGPDVTLQLANSLWIQDSYPVHAAYLAGVAADYHDAAYEADFADHLTEAVAAINAWVKGVTAGHISTLFPPGALNPSTVMVLANALHFEATWAARMTSTHEAFAEPVGTEQVPAITTMADLPHSTSDGLTAVAVPYKGGRFEALAIQPDSGSLTSFLNGLSGAKLARIVSGLHQGLAHLTMPTLDLHADQSLDDALSSLGMGAAFGPSPDFLPISSEDPTVETVEQADLLKVDRFGTEADAATGIGLVPTAVVAPAAIPAIRIDRPYLLVIRDTKTGTVLMSAAVSDPAAA